MQLLYFLLCIGGTVLPLLWFFPWLAGHGPDVPLLLAQAYATPVSAFAWTDVLVSAAALVLFVLFEGRRIGMRHAWVALLGLAMGVSLALPLFLLLRHRHLAARQG